MIIARPRPTLLHRLGLAAAVLVLASSAFLFEAMMFKAMASGPATSEVSPQKIAAASPAQIRTQAAARPARTRAVTKPHRVRTAQQFAARHSAPARDTCGWFWCSPRQVSVLFLGIGF